MKITRKTSDGKKGGLFVGKSHAKGGIPAIVVDTGQPIEVEGGEAIINKEATKKYWKQLSSINQSAGNGNPIPPPTNLSDNPDEYRKGGNINDMSPSELKKFYASPEGKKLDAETYAEWKRLVNMSKSELQAFYDSKEGKTAGLSKAKADELGIDNGRTSARWIFKMKDIPYTEWTSQMWIWAKKQISFIKRMSKNRGSLYEENGKKTRKYLSLLIWGHDPEKFAKGGKTKEIQEKNRGGNCFEIAGKIAMATPETLKLMGLPKFHGTPYVVHAQVIGQGDIEGVKYGHAWVEDDLFVYDFSNGRKIIFPKELYYLLGGVQTKKPIYFKYEFWEARKLMLDTGHYGSWNLITESGL